jgi:hypothetical protein
LTKKPSYIGGMLEIKQSSLRFWGNLWRRIIDGLLKMKKKEKIFLKPCILMQTGATYPRYEWISDG